MQAHNKHLVWVMTILFILMIGCSDGVDLSGKTAGANGTCFFMGGSKISPIYFAARTPVLMADGSLKEICIVEKGDKVMGYDLYRNKPIDLEVGRRTSKSCETCLLVNGSIRVNCSRPFYPAAGSGISYGNVSANVGLLLGDSDGNVNTLEKIVVTRIDTVSLCDQYYDLKFSRTHTYFVVDDGGNRYLVKTSPPTGTLYGGWN